MKRFPAVWLVLGLSTRTLAAQCPDGTPPPCGPAAARLPRIQVLGFAAGSGDSSIAYIADALTDDVIASLRSAGSVVVLSARATRGSADYQLSGRVGGSADRITISARLEHADGRIAWTFSRERMRRDLPAAAGELSRELLQSLGLRARPAGSQRAVDPQLYDVVLRGRYQLARRTPGALARATVLFRQAIAQDSTSALGWAWLAQSLFYMRLLGFPVPGMPPESTLAAEIAAADRAVELDPSSPVVWVTRAVTALEISPTNRSSALAALRRSIALDSLQPRAWRLLGQVLEETGDSAGAMAALRRAVAIAPDEGEQLAILGLHTLWRRDYAGSLRWADSAMAVDPILAIGRAVAAQAAFWSGRVADAENHITAQARLGPVPDVIGGALEVRLPLARGDSTAAREALAAMRERAGSLPSLHMSVSIADGLVALGDTAQALLVLERFPVPGQMHFQMHLRLERGLDPLRGSPRFQALLIPPRN